MQSNNPIFQRSPEFNGSGAGNQTYAGNGGAYPGYGQQSGSDPATWSTGTPTTTDRSTGRALATASPGGPARRARTTG